jgi:uncharacterized protein (DUF1499 family)
MMGQTLRLSAISCFFFFIFTVQLNGLQQGSVFDIRRIGKAFCTSIASLGIIVGGIDVSGSNADTSAVKVAPALFGLKKDRLLPCKAASNCISSSSFQSLEHYGKPWSFSESNSADEEFSQIVNALKSTEFRLKIVDQNDEKRYIRAEARSAIPITGTDDLEFLVNPIDKIITYRTNSREVAMAGPQVITDGGSNKNRLDIIRRKLGVYEMGESEESIKFMAKEQSMGFISKMRRDSTPNEINFIDNSVPAQAKEIAAPAQSVELK